MKIRVRYNILAGSRAGQNAIPHRSLECLKGSDFRQSITRWNNVVDGKLDNRWSEVLSVHEADFSTFGGSRQRLIHSCFGFRHTEPTPFSKQ